MKRSPDEKTKKTLRKRCTAAALIFLVLFCTVSCVTVLAYDEVNKITVTVGYWGGMDYTKKEVSLNTLASACGTNQAVYTWINAGSSPGTTEAEGVYLSDIMNYCGIDLNSIYYYNFYTADGNTYGGAMQQWTTSQLFQERYSYVESFYRVLDDYNSDTSDFIENPERHFTVADIFDFENRKFSDDAWNDRVPVEPMLALKTKASQWKGYVPASNLDFSSLTTTGRPILLFGQAGRNDVTRNLQAQMVTQIHIWFDGVPDIRLESAQPDGKIGDKGAVSLSVSTPDEFLSEQIRSEVTLSSSDEGVATVAQDGTITFNGEGTAEIEAVYNGRVYGRLSVSGTQKGEEPAEEDPSEEAPTKEDPEKQDPTQPTDSAKGSGSGSGSSSGDGSGSASGANTGEGAGAGSGSESASGSGDAADTSHGKKVSDGGSSVSLRTQPPNAKQAAEHGRGNIAQAKQAGSAGGAASGSGDDKVKVYRISEADNVYMESVISKSTFRGMWFGGTAAVALGLILELCYYRGQTNWVGRAKKIYEKL